MSDTSTICPTCGQPVPPTPAPHQQDDEIIASCPHTTWEDVGNSIQDGVNYTVQRCSACGTGREVPA